MSQPLIDRAQLERLERLTIHWRSSFAGLVGGRRTARHSGAGTEFLDHRRFHHGDDLRAVNWRAYMRLEKLFLKMFHAEPRAPIRILLDTSASMDAEAGKFDYARRVAACLAYIGLVRHDALMIQPFGETLGESCIASGGRHRFGPVSDFLLTLEARGRSRFVETARQFLAQYTGAGLLIVVSDFLDDADVLHPLEWMADYGHELLLLQVHTRTEREGPGEGIYELEDVENGARAEIDMDGGARKAYTAAFDRYAGQIEDIATRTGGRFCALSTDVALDDAVTRALELIAVR